MTQEEAREAIDLTIQSMPNSLRYSNDFELLVSKEMANTLLRSMSPVFLSLNLLSGFPLSNKVCFESGEKFKWRGVTCKVL